MGSMSRVQEFTARPKCNGTLPGSEILPQAFYEAIHKTSRQSYLQIINNKVTCGRLLDRNQERAKGLEHALK